MTLMELHDAVQDALDEWGNIPVRAASDYEHEITYADPVDTKDGLFFEIGLQHETRNPMDGEESWHAPQDPGHKRAAKWRG